MKQLFDDVMWLLVMPLFWNNDHPLTPFLEALHPPDCILNFCKLSPSWEEPFKGYFDATCNVSLFEIVPLNVIWWYDWFPPRSLDTQKCLFTLTKCSFGWEYKSRPSLSSHAQNHTRTRWVLTLMSSASCRYIPSMHLFLQSYLWTKETITT